MHQDHTCYNSIAIISSKPRTLKLKKVASKSNTKFNETFSATLSTNPIPRNYFRRKHDVIYSYLFIFLKKPNARTLSLERRSVASKWATQLFEIICLFVHRFQRCRLCAILHARIIESSNCTEACLCPYVTVENPFHVATLSINVYQIRLSVYLNK